MSEYPTSCDTWQAQVEAFARAIGVGESAHEVRVLMRFGERPGVLSGRFNDPDKLPTALAPWREKAHCLLTINPVRLASDDVHLNRIARHSRCASDADVVRRAWLMVDCDAVRPKALQDFCATDQERAAAIELRDSVEAELKSALSTELLRMSSGNGGTLLIPVFGQYIDGKDVAAFLRALAGRFDSSCAKIDCVVHNAARLTRIAGTTNVKQPNAERPRRTAVFENPAARPQPISFDRIRDYTLRSSARTARNNGSRDHGERKISPGTRHNTMMRCAGAMRRVGISEASILQGITAVNAEECDPPLAAAELSSIARSAGKYEPAPSGKQEQAEVVTIADVEEQELRWLWWPYLPAGKLVMIDGDPNRGKSFLTLDLAARVSRGDRMPDGAEGVHGNVMLMSIEDAIEDTIKPRLRALGADQQRVQVFRGFSNGRLLELGVEEDMRALESKVVEYRTLLLIFDPLVGFFGERTNTHRDQDVRRALASLIAMAHRTGVAVVGIRHLNKTAGPAAMYRGSGSIAIVGAARSAFVVGLDPDDNDLRVFAQTKTNLAQRAPSLGFRLLASGQGIPEVKWEGVLSRSADELVGAEVLPRGKPSLEAAQAFLVGMLANGPMMEATINERRTRAGISAATLRRAKEELGVNSRKCATGWRWELPAGQDAHDHDHERLDATGQLELHEDTNQFETLDEIDEGDHRDLSADPMIALPWPSGDDD